MRTHRAQPAVRAWPGLIALAALAGCGIDPNPDPGTLYPVKGKVLLPGGKPMTGGGVSFMATKGPLVTATGKVGPDGSFALETSGKEGAPATDYRVRIVPDPATLTYTRRGASKVLDTKKLPFDAHFLDEEASELIVTVKPGPNDLEPIRLTNGPAKSSLARGRGARD